MEAGYSDGIISPVFLCALAVAAGEQHRRTPLDALKMAVPPVINALIGEAADTTLLITVLVVPGSIVTHGAGSPAMARL